MGSSCDSWQVNCKTVVERNGHLLNMAMWTDCTFQVGSAEHTQQFKAHKVILASASPVFEAMFFGEMSGTKPLIEIIDVEPDIFQQLLRYVYTESVEMGTVDMAWQIYYVADKYILPELMDKCIHYISTNLTVTNVLRGYEFSKFHNKTSIIDKCLQFISEHCEEVLTDDCFCEADINTVMDIYNLPALNISSEVILLKAAEKYLMNQDKPEFSSVISSSSSSLSIHDAVQRIHFLCLTPQQFAQDVSETTLLSQSEKCDVILNISSAECKTPMPEGFSTSKEIRRHGMLNETDHYRIKLRRDQKTDVVEKLCKFFLSVVFYDTSSAMRNVISRLRCTRWEVYCIQEDMNRAEINEVLHRYYCKEGYLVAPASLASCVDMRKVTRVINYDLPSDREYILRVARKRLFDFIPVTFNLVMDEQEQSLKSIEDYYSIALKEMPVNFVS